MNDTLLSLHQQIINSQNSLRMIEERMTEYVLATDIPLQLIREKDQVNNRLIELQERLQLLHKIPCPYRGMDYFDIQHVTNYFGRTNMIEKVLLKLQETSFVAVVGPSGSGKSSLVRAGVIHALSQTAMTVKQKLKIEIFRPGENPLFALAVLLVRLLDPALSLVDQLDVSEKLIKKLETGNISSDTIFKRLQIENSNLVIVVDQFEEIFTLCKNEYFRSNFLDMLLTIDKPWLKIIITLRADFYGKVLERTTLGERIDKGLVNVLPMNYAEYRAAIEQPAHQAGRRFEDGLVERLLTDVQIEPSQLPLLEFALTELWSQQKNDGLLTHIAYQKIGGVIGAIAKRSDTILKELMPNEQDKIRAIMTRLVCVSTPEEGSEDTKRRMDLSEFDSRERILIQQLADARLLVTGRDEQTNTDTVEIAHEALIRRWNIIKIWLNNDREFLLWRQRLRTLIDHWQASNREQGSLLRGTLLVEAEEWLRLRMSNLTVVEKDYITASHELSQKELDEKKAINLRLRTRARLLAGLSVVALTLAVSAIWFSVQSYLNASDAEKQRLAFEQMASRSLAEQMAAQAIVLIEREGAANDQALLLIRQATRIIKRLSLDVTDNVDKALRLAAENIRWHETFPPSAHRSPINSLAFSPNGKYVISGSSDSTVRLWTIEGQSDSLQLQAILTGHKSKVLSVAFSPDSTKIISASEDHTVRIWDTFSGKSLHILYGHSFSVTNVRYSPNGDQIASASLDQTLRIWDSKTGSLIRVLQTGPVTDLAFSPNGKQIAAVVDNKFVQVWDFKSGEPLFSLPNHSETVYTIAYSPDGKFLASAGKDKFINLWNIDNGELLFSIIGQNESIYSLVFSPNSNFLAFAGSSGSVYIWNIIEQKLFKKLTGHSSYILSIDYDQSGSKIASGGFDHSIHIWDVKSGDILGTTSCQTDSISTAFFSPDDKQIVSASNDNSICIWDRRTKKVVLSLKGHEKGVYSALYSPNGKLVVSASADKTIRIWDAHSGKLIHTFRGHTKDVTWATFSPDGKYVASSSKDQTLRIWDMQSGNLIKVLLNHKETIWSIAYSITGKQIASAGDGKVIYIWDIESSKILHTLEVDQAGTLSISYSPDNKYIIAAGLEGKIYIWESNTGNLIRTISGHSGFIYSALYSTDGRFIVSANSDRTVKVWDSTNGALIYTLRGHTDDVFSAAFSQDNKAIVSASRDHTVRLWTMGSAEYQQVFDGHAFARYAVFSPDGKHLASLGFDGVRVWDLQTRRMIYTYLLTIGPFYTGDYESLIYSPDGKNVLIMNTRTKSIVVLDAHTGKLIRTIKEYKSTQFAAFIQNGQYLLTSNGDWVSIRDIKTDTLISLRRIGYYTNNMNISSDKKHLIFTCYDASYSNNICIWDIEKGKLIQTIIAGISQTNFVTYSPDDKLAASADRDKQVRIWDIETGRVVQILKGNREPVLSVAFSPNGEFVASAGEDQTVRIWNLASGKLLNTLKGHTDDVNYVAYSPNGKWVVSASSDGTVRVWPSDADKIIQQIELHIQRPSQELTEEEWWDFGLTD